MKKYKGLIIPLGLKSKKEIAKLLEKYPDQICSDDFFSSKNCVGIFCKDCLMSWTNYMLRLEWATKVEHWKPKDGDTVWRIDPIYLRIWQELYAPKEYPSLLRDYTQGWIYRTRKEAREVVAQIKQIIAR